MDKILEVKNLQISFKTNNGTVKAVRDISFDLNRGQTLAIVGESGSGKSVTSKAIMGILAGNSIVDGGEILYDGRDLLKVSEEELNKLRGDKISMIFQDPLSSLNPIIKIGNQITEAMLLKNRTTRKNARNDFNSYLQELKLNMIESSVETDKEKISKMIETFDQFSINALKLEGSYNSSLNMAENAYSKVEDLLFLMSKNQKVDEHARVKYIVETLKNIKDRFIITNLGSKIEEVRSSLANANFEDTNDMVANLNKAKALFDEIISLEKPNFFRIGYYSYVNKDEDIYSYDIKELNQKTLTYLDENFMREFIEYTVKALKNSHKKAIDAKKDAIVELENLKNFFIGTADLDKKESFAKIKELKLIIDSTNDKLETNKDTLLLTFNDSIKTALKSYFYHKVNNVKEKERFERQNRKYEELLNKGKRIDWKVIPQKVVSIESIQENIVKIIERLITSFNNDLDASKIDFKEKAIKLVDYFKEKASIVVHKITKYSAKEKAIKLMEEVGIPEARLRYYQYPFQFSGGMRQRIVIAIALAADPDILICDEPTTALDVTIQAQILELINELKVKRNLSIIFITHDLGVVANMADSIAVMYAGKIVEYGTVNDIFYSPAHPYTWALLSSMPDLETNEKLEAIPGTPPNMIYPPVGDAFAERNKYAMKIDFEKQPPMFKISDTHYAATWLLHPNAPKVEMPSIIVDRIKRMKKLGGDNNG